MKIDGWFIGLGVVGSALGLFSIYLTSLTGVCPSSIFWGSVVLCTATPVKVLLEELKTDIKLFVPKGSGINR